MQHYIMSVTIDIGGFFDHPPSPTYLFAIVSGSQAGTLISEPYNPDAEVWSPPLKIQARSTDNLTFDIYRAAKKSKQLVGSASLCLPRLLQQQEGKLSSKFDFDYSIDVRLEDEIVGELRLMIRYDPSILFEGELTQSVSLNMRKEREYISFYQGKCNKVNAFSFLDQSSKGQYCRFAQSVYRDMQ